MKQYSDLYFIARYANFFDRWVAVCYLSLSHEFAEFWIYSNMRVSVKTHRFKLFACEYYSKNSKLALVSFQGKERKDCYLLPLQ